MQPGVVASFSVDLVIGPYRQWVDYYEVLIKELVVTRMLSAWLNKNNDLE